METATAVQKVACTGRNHVLRLLLALPFPQITQRAGTFSPCFCQRHQSVPSVKMPGLQKRRLKPTEGPNSVADRAGWAVTLAPGVPSEAQADTEVESAFSESSRQLQLPFPK